MGLEALSPAYQTQYEALIPEIERAVRAKNTARGMFYSGQAGDEEVRAKADLLAKLASESAATEARASEGERNRRLEEKLKNEEIKASKRNALLGMIGGGASSAAGLAGLAMLRPEVAGQPIQLADGSVALFNPKSGKLSPLSMAETGSSTRAPIDMAAAPGRAGLFEVPTPKGTSADLVRGDFGVPGTSSTPVAPATPSTSFWKNPALSPTNLLSGAAGGGLGYLLSRSAGGGSSLGGDIGAGVGGAAGYAGGLKAAPYLLSKFGMTSPWAAGLGALLGSTGGGLLGNLFR